MNRAETGFWGVLALCSVCLLPGCARGLRDESFVPVAPVELNQKIEKASNDDIKKAVDATPPPKVEAPVTKAAKVGKSAKGKKALREAEAKSKAAPEAPAWIPSSWPFGVGEKITMVMRYGVLEGGIATLEVDEPQMLEGEPVLHFIGKVRSSRVLELFYKVNDDIQSWIGLSDFLPRRQEIRQNESSRTGRRVVVFDNKAKIARFFSRTEYSTGRVEEVRRDDAITHYAQDIFGALYFYRFLASQDRINFPIHDRWKNWLGELTFVNKEEVTVPAGRFQTNHYKMVPRIQGYLQPQGDIDIWLMDDPARIMVQFKAKIKVGTMTGELREFVPGRPFDLAVPQLRTPTGLTALGESDTSPKTK